jgi:Domain of unknown function (DUF4493)/Lamin Tail Domain
MNPKSCLCLVIFLALLFSCKKDDILSESAKGTLVIHIGLFISIDDEENALKSTVAGEEFLVTIFNSLGVQVMQFAHASEIPDEIEIEPGEYYVTAHSNNNLPAAFENPYYYGETPRFTISSGNLQAVTVNCQLANTIVTILYSDQVKNNFTDYATTVSTSAGSLVYQKDEIRAGYFQPLPLTISVALTWQKDDGSSVNKTLSGMISSPLARKKYEIHVDASSMEGSAAFQINVDESNDTPEIVYISDTDPSVPGILNAGDLLITEIMADPDALSDSEGEWFEIYNNTNHTVDLHHLVIRKSTDDQHIINSSILLPAHEFFVLARTDIAVSGSKYIYGTSISLTNTGASLSISNYGSDGSDGSVICSINYGAEEFPNAASAGASLSLSPLHMNYTDVLSGNSWCLSTSEYSTGDLGTPGIQNDPCL